MNTKLKISTLIAVGLLAACGSANPPAGGQTPPPGGDTAAGFLTGTVHDSQGQPLGGVQVFADHTQYYNTNAIGVSDAGGKYRIDVRQPAGSWHATAQLKRSYHGQNYTFDLQPDNDNPFPGSEGATRNFVWKLTGPTPNGEDTYGGIVAVYADYSNYSLDLTQVELTLVPDGPLVDGSEGQTIVRKLVNTPDGDAVPDVPVGRYTVTARYAPAGEAPRPLLIRLRDQGNYEKGITADFVQKVGSQMMVLQVDEAK
jgi:hypothetical protein